MFTMMSICNAIHSVLTRKHVYQHHEMLAMSKLSIKKAINLAQMMKILNKIISVIVVLQLSSKMITENSV